MTLVKAALGYIASAYVNDAVLRPRQLGAAARAYCDRARKPLLLIQGAGLAATFLGAPVRAEVTSSRAYPLGCPNRVFGAILAVGTLERLQRPDLALREWRRAADKVFVVVPSWWAPHAWFDPENRWWIDADLRRARPLWTADRRVYLLSVSDKGYGQPRWSPSMQQSRPMTPPKRSLMMSRGTQSNVGRRSEPTAPAPTAPNVPSLPSPSGDTSSPSGNVAQQLPVYESETSTDTADLFEEEGSPNLPSDSSSYPQMLMVVSELSYDES